MIQLKSLKHMENIEDRYYVTTCGKVISISNKGLRILKTFLDKDGYEKIVLSSRNKKCFYVHRLVALAFIPNNDLSKNIINHKDEVKTHNYVQNLEWCDHVYNINYGSRSKKSAIKHSKKVYKYDINGNYIESYDSLTQASKENNVNISVISSCISNKCKSCGGFIWKSFKKDKISKKIHGSSIKVKSIDKEGNEIIYNSLSEANKITGIPVGNISKVISGQRHTAGGYIWKYAKEGDDSE